jgi:hypothetical protein
MSSIVYATGTATRVNSVEVIRPPTEAVRQFCIRIGDDPARTVNAILEAMPDEITEAVKTELGR